MSCAYPNRTLVPSVPESTMTRMRYRISNYSAWLNHTESNFSQVSISSSVTIRINLMYLTRCLQTIEPTAIPPLIQTILPHYPPLDVETSSYYSNITGFLSGGVKVHNLSTPISGLRKEWIPYIESFAQGLNHSDAAERTAPWRNWNLASKTLSNVREYPVKHLKQGAFLTVRPSSMGPHSWLTSRTGEHGPNGPRR